MEIRFLPNHGGKPRVLIIIQRTDTQNIYPKNYHEYTLYERTDNVMKFRRCYKKGIGSTKIMRKRFREFERIDFDD
jgi:hypothetical protein